MGPVGSQALQARLHFLTSLAARCGCVTKFWSMGVSTSDVFNLRRGHFFLSFSLLLTDYMIDVMAGVPAAIVGHEVTLGIEASRIR